jgi:5-methylcytosine-specific restriction endonuclease McrA
VEPTLFDGKVCRKCGLWKPFSGFHRNRAEPDGYQYYCKPCRVGENAHRADYFRAYLEPHREAKKAYLKEWRQKNLAYKREKNREWALAHPEKVRASNSKWGAANYSRILAKGRAYRAAHPLKARFWAHTRRTRKHQAGGSYTPQEWEALCALFGHRCLCCGAEGTLTVDHIIPLALRGSNSIHNLQPLCGSCNKKKNAKTIDYRPGFVALWALTSTASPATAAGGR